MDECRTPSLRVFATRTCRSLLTTCNRSGSPISTTFHRWINGGSPTEGFLSFGTKGPFADFFQSFAGAAWADWLFMLGLLGIGTALILGIGTRVAAVSGATMLLLMWAASAIWPENNPFIDDHIIYAIALGLLAFIGAGRTWGLGKIWERIPYISRHGWLK